MPPLSERDLRERVVIWRPVAATDSQGGRTVTWVDLVTGHAGSPTRLWAAVTPSLDGRSRDETLATAAVTTQTVYTVWLRYRGDVTSAMRIQWCPYRAAPKTLEIQSVTLLPDRCWVRLDCVEATV